MRYSNRGLRGGSLPAANRLSVDSSEQTADGAVVNVVVRLIDGDQIVAGTHGDSDEARRSAEELLRKFSKGEGEWLFVEGRYLRPQAVVSIDLVDGEQRRWGGSPDRRMSMPPGSAD